MRRNELEMGQRSHVPRMALLHSRGRFHDISKLITQTATQAHECIHACPNEFMNEAPCPKKIVRTMWKKHTERFTAAWLEGGQNRLPWHPPASSSLCTSTTAKIANYHWWMHLWRLWSAWLHAAWCAFFHLHQRPKYVPRAQQLRNQDLRKHVQCMHSQTQQWHGAPTLSPRSIVQMRPCMQSRNDAIRYKYWN